MLLDPNDFPTLSENHAKKLRALKQKKFRDRDNLFLAEGVRLCEDALAGEAKVRDVIITNEALRHARIAALVQNIIDKKHPVHISSVRLFKTLSDEKSPQGILFVVEKPVVPPIDTISGPLIVGLDDLQDPGNLGAILRSAEWFGVKEIVLSPGCVDPYNPKVVRSSMGAIFRIVLCTFINLEEFLARFKERGYRAVGSMVNASTNLPNVSATGKDVLLIGNEANGLSPALSSLIDLSVRIPGQGQGESLNAAMSASIFLYHFAQKVNPAA